MISLTFEVTLQFDEEPNSAEVELYLHHAIEAARSNSELTADDVCCTNAETHLVNVG